MKSKKILKIIAAISGLLAILNIAYRLIVHTSIRIGGSSAIGIIGSADGPTTIWVTKGENGISSFLIENFFVLCIVVNVISVVLLLKNKNKKEK